HRHRPVGAVPHALRDAIGWGAVCGAVRRFHDSSGSARLMSNTQIIERQSQVQHVERRPDGSTFVLNGENAAEAARQAALAAEQVALAEAQVALAEAQVSLAGAEADRA